MCPRCPPVMGLPLLCEQDTHPSSGYLRSPSPVMWGPPHVKGSHHAPYPLNPCGQASVNEHVSERHLRRSPSFYFKGMCKRQQTRHRTTSQLLETSFLCDITPPSTAPQHLHRWNPDTACSSSRSRACGAPSKGPGILLLARAPRTSLSTQMSPRTEGSARQQSRQEIPL